ncbi:winged helix-turn-helix domain-containing protein [Serratia liquefaciens]|uniref:winged helix-turn-helix domain-containing protein n=1 Tax=Serratia liquefaciens TaxID=614 RepID=UPI0021582616|nr:helix-turn-helix domain-containing protein [Serratia liquefaciens]
MKYLIDNIVVFSSEDETLTGVKDREDISEKLPHPTAMLLLELIKRKNEVVSRPILLECVWEKQGAVPSDATLNNHLSLIRKKFDFWGVDRNKLKTIPRKGIVFNGDIDILPLFSAPQASPFTVEEPRPVPVPVPAPKKPTHQKKTKRNTPIFYVSTMTAVMLGVGAFFLNLSDDNYNPIETIANVDKCNIKPLGNTLTTPRIPFVDEALKIVSDSSPALDCTVPQDVYVSVTTLTDTRIVFLTTCTIASTDTYKKCVNISRVEKRAP